MTRAFLEGRLVDLRHLEPGDASGPYADWFNDVEVCRGNSHHVFPFTPEQARDYIAKVRNARDCLVLAIVRKTDGRHVGNVALQQIHPIHRSAEFAIVIGDRTAWGKGFSKEAARLICAHGFEALNLHRIGCGTYASNQAMVRLAKHLGMRPEGRRRRAAFKSNRYHDILEFGVLRSEFQARFSGGDQ